MSWMKTNQIQAVLVETVKGFWSHHGLVLTKPEKIGNSQNMISNDDEKNNSVTPVAENNQTSWTQEY